VAAESKLRLSHLLFRVELFVFCSLIYSTVYIAGRIDDILFDGCAADSAAPQNFSTSVFEPNSQGTIANANREILSEMNIQTRLIAGKIFLFYFLSK